MYMLNIKKLISVRPIDKYVINTQCIYKLEGGQAPEKKPDLE